MLKNNTFLTSILKGFRLRFGRVFGRFFGPKMHENCKNTLLAKTLKIVVFPRENLYFQGFQDNKYTKTVAKTLEKIEVFWNIDFEGVLKGFGDGFGRPKSSIFAVFSRKNASKKQEDFWKAKKSHFERKKCQHGPNIKDLDLPGVTRDPPLSISKQGFRRKKSNGVWHAWRCEQRGGFWRGFR